MNKSGSEGPSQRQCSVDRDHTLWKKLPPGSKNIYGSEGPSSNLEAPDEQLHDASREASKTVSEMTIQQQRQEVETINNVSVDPDSDSEPEVEVLDANCRKILEAESVAKSCKGSLIERQAG